MGKPGRPKATWSVWSKGEDDQLRRFYPDVPKLVALLPNRTSVAIKCRALKLGLVTPRKRWTPERQYVLRQLSGRVTEEVIAQMMGRSVSAIHSQRTDLGLAVPQKTPTKAALPVVQDIIDEARARKVSLVDLSKKHHCAIVPSRTWQSLSTAAVVRVVKALSGELYVDWED